MSLSCPMMMSTMRPKFAFRANSSAGLGLALHVAKRISGCEKNRDQVAAA